MPGTFGNIVEYWPYNHDRVLKSAAMTNPKFLWILIVVLLLGHVGLSMQRQPNTSVSGDQIHPAKSWANKDSRNLRVSTFNIHRAEGLDEKTDINRIAELLLEDDIAGLQEVLAAPIFSEKDQSAELAEITGNGWLFAPIQKRYYRDYLGNALLSRHEVKSWLRQPLIWSDQLGNTDRSRRYRNMIIAQIELAGKEVTLINTHLDRGAIRESQLTQVLDEFDRHSTAILTADLNTNIRSEVLKSWLKQNPEADAIGQALGDQDNEKRIDWILVKGFDVIEGGTTPEGASDHPYYWAKLELIQ